MRLEFYLCTQQILEAIDFLGTSQPPLPQVNAVNRNQALTFSPPNKTQYLHRPPFVPKINDLISN